MAMAVRWVALAARRASRLHCTLHLETGLRAAGCAGSRRWLGAAAPTADSILARALAEPIVATYHLDGEKGMARIRAVSTTEDALALFDAERDRFGWVAAAELLKGMSKRLAKNRRLAGPLDPADGRLAALMAVPELAMAQNVMNSTARRGHATDDLKALRTALAGLGLGDSALHAALEAKLKEEEEEMDSAEPGEFGHDFQGGGIGF